jgi:uncharacterized membrane protein
MSKMKVFMKVLKRIFWNTGTQFLLMFVALVTSVLLSCSVLSLPFIFAMHTDFWRAFPWGVLVMVVLSILLLIFAKLQEFWTEEEEKLKEEKLKE